MSDQKDMQAIAKAKGRPMLTWVGKKPLDKIEYFPAQEKEVYGDLSAQEFNKLFWGDNLQVLSHLLREYRGKVDLTYIDPPFDSRADYVKKITFRGEQIAGEQQNLLEEKQYTDIWENDEYLQFMYERILILRELLSENGVLFLHCDWTKGAYLKCILDEVFGTENSIASISWRRSSSGKTTTKSVIDNTDLLFGYSKGSTFTYNPIYTELSDTTKAMYKYDDNDGRGKYRLYPLQKTNTRTPGTTYDFIDNEGRKWPCPAKGWRMTQDKLKALENDNRLFKNAKTIAEKAYWNERDNDGKLADNIWVDVFNLQGGNPEITSYPTQKPETLVQRIVSAYSNDSDLVLDCFCGSGTTLAVAQKLGRRWIGCDINIGAIQTTTKRLSQILQDQQSSQPKLTEGDFKGLNAFKVLNVNNYDIFKNELEAKEIVMDVYGVDPIKKSYFDGMLDNNFVKVLPLNRVLNKHDITLLLKNINDSIDGFTVKPTTATGEHLYEEGVVVICSGVELDAEDFLKKQNGTGVPISIKNILRDKQNLVFKQKPEAEIKLSVDGKKLTVEVVDFYSPILMRRLELENKKVIDASSQAKVEDFHQIIDSVAIDIDYNGELFNAEIMDLPDKKSVIAAKYEHEYSSKGKKKIAIKIVDVLGEEYFESFEVEVGV